METPLDEIERVQAGTRAPARSNHWNVPLALSVAGLVLLGFNDTKIAAQKVSDWAFVAAAGAACLDLVAGRLGRLAPFEQRRTPPVILVGTLVLMLGGALSSFWSLDPFASILEVARYGSVTLLWFWLLRTVAPDRATLLRLVKAFKATVLISCIFAISGFLGLTNLNPPGPNANRQTAFFGHSNLLAFLLAIGLPLFLLDVGSSRPDNAEALTVKVKQWIRRWGWSGVIVFSLGTTGSLTGALAAIMGLLTLGVGSQLSRGRKRRRVARTNPLALMLALMIVPIALVLFANTNVSLFERLDLFREGDADVTSSAGSRGEFDAFVINHIQDRLAIGIGLDTESALALSAGSAGFGHNMYLTVLLTAGLPALLGLITVLWWGFSRCWTLVRVTRDAELYSLSLALLGSLMTASFAAFFHPISQDRIFWFPTAMISVLFAIRRRELRTPAGNALARQ